MCPQLNHLFISNNRTGIWFRHSLEHFTQVTKIESIMRFGWCWSELFLHIIVNLNCCTSDIFLQLFYISTEWYLSLTSVHPLHNVTEDIVEWSIWVWFDIYDIEMADVSVGDAISTTAGWAHCSNKAYFLSSSKVSFRLVDIVPTTIVHPLSK
jgi:hypothetical protein